MFISFRVRWERTVSVVANVLNCDLAVSEFELQSLCYAHFRTNTLGKDMNYFSPYSYGLKKETLLFISKDCFGIR